MKNGSVFVFVQNKVDNYGFHDVFFYAKIKEVNLAGGYQFVSTNLATNNVFNTFKHRNQEHLKLFFKNLTEREMVEWVCKDVWRSFKRSFA